MAEDLVSLLLLFLSEMQAIWCHLQRFSALKYGDVEVIFPNSCRDKQGEYLDALNAWVPKFENTGGFCPETGEWFPRQEETDSLQ